MANTLVPQIRSRHPGCYRDTIDDIRLCFPVAPDQDIFGPLLRPFPFRIPQGVFSLFPVARSSSRINRAFIYQAGTFVAFPPPPPPPPLFRPSTRMYACDYGVEECLGTAFVCGSVTGRPSFSPCSLALHRARGGGEGLGPFASWEIGVKILHGVSLD